MLKNECHSISVKCCDVRSIQFLPCSATRAICSLLVVFNGLNYCQAHCVRLKGTDPNIHCAFLFRSELPHCFDSSTFNSCVRVLPQCDKQKGHSFR